VGSEPRAMVISPPPAPDVPSPPLPVLSPSSPHAAAARPRASSGTNTTRPSRMRPPPDRFGPSPKGHGLLYTFDKMGESRTPRAYGVGEVTMSDSPHDL